MKQLLIELDEDTAAQLEQVAPARSRRRSEFVRMAIRQALWARAEEATAEAYRQTPDSEDAHWDPATWEARPAAAGASTAQTAAVRTASGGRRKR